MRTGGALTTIELARRIEQGGARGAEDSVRVQLAMRPACGAAMASLAGGAAIFGGVGSPLSRARALGMSGRGAHNDLRILSPVVR